MEEMTQDLAEHLAFHASVGYAVRRDMDPPAVPELVEMANNQGLAFEVEHAGRRFLVMVEER